jgi:hypothetical protein
MVCPGTIREWRNLSGTSQLGFIRQRSYEESCTGDWEIHGGKSSFVWQFQESAKKFEISNQSLTTGSHSTDEAVIQCQQFSGVYDVAESEKDEMEFTSTKTLGFLGKKVVIKITRGGHRH